MLAVAARGDWNFSVHQDWLVCLLTAPFGSAAHVAATVDAVATLAGTLPGAPPGPTLAGWME